MNNLMISLQEVWEAAGGHKDVKPTKEQMILILKQLDNCVDTQEEEIRKLEKENSDLKDMISSLANLKFQNTLGCLSCNSTGISSYINHGYGEDSVEAVKCESCEGFGY